MDTRSLPLAVSSAVGGSCLWFHVESVGTSAKGPTSEPELRCSSLCEAGKQGRPKGQFTLGLWMQLA